MFFEILSHIFDNINPLILHGVGIALLTILIPVAITIFGSTKEFEILDRNVVLDHMINAKRFPLYLGMIFAPLIFWGFSSTWFRLGEIIVWGIGIYFVLGILFNAYRWMKGNKLDLRCEYLTNVKSSEDIVASWRSLWQSEKVNLQDERRLLGIFLSTIDRLLSDNEQQL